MINRLSKVVKTYLLSVFIILLDKEISLLRLNSLQGGRADVPERRGATMENKVSSVVNNAIKIVLDHGIYIRL